MRGLGLRVEGLLFDEDVRYAQLGAVYRFGRRGDERPVLLVERRTTPVGIPAVAVPRPAPRAVPASDAPTDPDADRDGVSGLDDRCPVTPSGTLVGSDGCAVATGVLADVVFPSGSAPG